MLLITGHTHQPVFKSLTHLEKLYKEFQLAEKEKNENMYGPLSGLCLETQKHPNAVNIPHFPNTVLRPGEMYHQKTVYKIST